MHHPPIQCKDALVVLPIVSGRQSRIEEWPGNLAAFAAGWLPLTAGRGVGEVLFNDHPLVGNLIPSRTASAVDPTIAVSDDIDLPIHRVLGR